MLSILLLLLAAAPTLGQVRWRSGTAPRSGKSKTDVLETIAGAGLRRGDRHLVVQFAGPVTPHQRSEAKEAGVTLLAWLGNHAFFAAAPPGLGGHPTLSVEQTLAANPVLRSAPTKHALLCVANTGCGMTPEVRDRIFEPYFSTKPKGTYGRRGMGMAIVYTAVNGAGGFVQDDSEVGAGTTFRVYFPAVAAPDAPSATSGQRIQES